FFFSASALPRSPSSPYTTLFRSVGTLGDFVVVGARGALQLGAELRVGLDELPREAGQPRHVLPDQHLTVAGGPGADADGGDGQLRGDAGGDLSGHQLEHDRRG